MYTKTCSQCGEPFTSKRNDAITCSGKCRARRYSELYMELQRNRNRNKAELLTINPSLTARLR